MTKRKSQPAGDPQDTAAPPAEIVKTPRPESKLAAIADRLKDPDGVTIAEMQALTGWQKHSVRGALAGTLTTKFGLVIVSQKSERGRVYRATQAGDQA